ncbi:MAG: ArnT family glycosyltransferase [Planctomycetota bacterium]
MRGWLSPLLIIVVVILGYGLGPTRLPLVGEETCRARHGIEMAQSGDWVIPTQQAVPILDRPPLQYWTFAIIHRWVRALDPLTLRVSMVVVIMGTALLIWWYARRFLSETGALLAAVAYPTMGHVFDLGRRVETDGQFTLLLAGALLVWHYGYAQKWKPLWTWTGAAAIAALATLTKGSQGPVAFFGAAWVFLVIRRDWRYLLCWSHVAGIVVFGLLIAAWQVPFFLQTGWEGTRETWLDPGASRVSADIVGFLAHLGGFPFVVIGASLPWSPLLIGLTDRSFWRLPDKLGSCVTFNLVGMAVIFVPVWLTAEGHHRYVMPLYPLMAVVCGAVVHQGLALDLSLGLRRLWRIYVRVMAFVVLGAAAGFLTATIAALFSDANWARTLAQPWWQMIVLAVVAAAVATLMLRRSSPDRPGHGLAVTFALASFLAIMFNGAVLNATAINAAEIGPEVAALRRALPDDVRLVSFRPLHHKFVYWYENPIPIVPRPTGPNNVPEDLTYFADNVSGGKTVKVPFTWEEIARFNMDRTRKDDPRECVVVGRRLPDGP